MAVEEDVEDIVGGKSYERTSVAAGGSEERNDEEYKAEADEIFWTRNEAGTVGKPVLDWKSGRKKGKRKTQDQIFGQLGKVRWRSQHAGRVNSQDSRQSGVASHGGQRPWGYGTAVR